MPGLRDNARKTLENNMMRDVPQASQEKRVLRKNNNANKPRDVTVPNSRQEYSHRSPVLKAYEAGEMPVDHRRLLEGIKCALDGKKEGEINLGKVLEELGFFRASALKMLKHMRNFGVLETESRYQGTWVKLLKD